VQSASRRPHPRSLSQFDRRGSSLRRHKPLQCLIHLFDP
jgi:hypothetical protein